MSSHCLAVVFSTSHLICGLAAFSTLFPEGGARLSIGVCDWPGASDAVNAERLEVLRRMTAGFPFVERVIPVGDAGIARAQNAPSQAKALEDVRRMTGLPAVEHLYFAHDCVGGVYQALCAAYPSARRVCYGDGFGECLTKEHYFKVNFYHGLDPNTPLRNRLILARYRLRRLGNRLRVGLARHRPLARRLSLPPLEHTYFPAHRLCLVLPTFYFSHSRCFPGMTVAPRPVVLEVLRRCADGAGALAYERRLLETCGGRKRILLATENLSEAGVITLDNEVAMYAETLEPYLSGAPVVIVKPHPGETSSRADLLRARLGDRAEVVPFDPAFARMPVELFTALLEGAVVVGSGPMLVTLKYLFDAEVAMSLTDPVIRRYFLPLYHDFHEDILKLTDILMKRLATWDGRSVLFEGYPT